MSIFLAFETSQWVGYVQPHFNVQITSFDRSWRSWTVEGEDESVGIDAAAILANGDPLRFQHALRL